MVITIDYVRRKSGQRRRMCIYQIKATSLVASEKAVFLCEVFVKHQNNNNESIDIT
jgi:hypothetical protein